MKKLSVFLCVIVLLLGISIYANAATFNINQITNNTNPALALSHPSLYDGKLAWMEQSISGTAIYYWDGTNVTQVAVGGTGGAPGDTYVETPSLYNGNVAFSMVSDGMSNIYVWDGINTQQITNNINPAISLSHPSIYDGRLAWMEQSISNTAIYYWDGVTTTQVVSRGSGGGPDPTYVQTPSLYDGNVAFSMQEGGSMNIYVWDGTNINQITNNTNPALALSHPSLYNDNLTWMEQALNTTAIYYWDGINVSQVVNGGEGADAMYVQTPSLYDGNIAFSMQDSDGMMNIYVATPVPAPATIFLLGSGLIGLAGAKRKFKSDVSKRRNP